MSLRENTESRNKFMEIIVSIEKNNKDDKMLKSLVNKSKQYLNRRMLSPKFEELKINKDKLLYFNKFLKKNKTIKNFKNFTSSLSHNKSDKHINKSKKNHLEISKKYSTCKNILERIRDDKSKKYNIKLKKNSTINDNDIKTTILNKLEKENEEKPDLSYNYKSIVKEKKKEKLEYLKNFFKLIDTHQKTQYEIYLDPTKPKLDFIRSKNNAKLFQTCVTYDKNDIFYNKKYKLIIDKINNKKNIKYNNINNSDEYILSSHTSNLKHKNKNSFLKKKNMSITNSNSDNFFFNTKLKVKKNIDNNIYIYNNNKLNRNLLKNDIYSLSDDKIKKSAHTLKSKKNNNYITNYINSSRPQTSITTVSNKTAKFVKSSQNETTDVFETSSLSFLSDINNLKTFNNSKKDSKISKFRNGPLNIKYRKKSKKILYDMLSDTLKKSNKMNYILKSNYNCKEKDEEKMEEKKLRDLIKKKRTNLDLLVKELKLNYKEQKIDLEELVIKNAKKLRRHLQNMKQFYIMNEVANKVIVEDKILSKEVFLESSLAKKLRKRIKTESDKEFEFLIKKRKYLKNKMIKYKQKTENDVMRGLMKNEILYDFEDMKSLENMLYKYRTMSHY